MSKFDDMMGRVNELLNPSSGNSAQMTQSSSSNPLGQMISAFNSVGVTPTDVNKVHSKTQTGGAFNNNPMNDIGLGIGAAATIGAPEDDAVMQAFTHNLGGAVGDITREFKPEEIQNAISQLQGKQLTGDNYTDNAIRLANYMTDKKSGAIMNAPNGGNLGL